MYNSKMRSRLIILCVVTGCLLCGCKDKKAESENTMSDNSTTENIAEEGVRVPEKASQGDEILLYTEALNDDSGNDEDNSIHKITEVKRGDFDYSMFAIGELHYLDTYYQTIDVDSATFAGYEVEVGDKVEKGDPIMNYEMEYNEVEVEQRTADILQREKDYSAEYNRRKAEINQAEHDLKNIKDADEKSIKELEIKKLRLALKEFEESEGSIIEARQELDEYVEGINSSTVYAEHSGYVLSLVDYNVGDYIAKGESVAVISPKKEYHVKVEDKSNGLLRYNADVTISVAADKGGKDIEMPGKVISASNILSYDNQKEEAYVKILEEPDGVNWGNAIKVYYNSRQLKDVLMVASEAVLFEKQGEGGSVNNVPYVYIYEDGKAFKRYIEVYGSNNVDYLVQSGLTEGQQVVIYQ